MKTWLILAISASIFPMSLSANNGLLDNPIHVSNRSEIIQRVEALNGALSPQEYFDLSIAVQRISVSCKTVVGFALSVQESDALFVGLVNDHTPRQIILIAAALALSESAAVKDRPDSGEGNRRATDADRREYGLRLKSEGLGLVQSYAQVPSDTGRRPAEQPPASIESMPRK